LEGEAGESAATPGRRARQLYAERASARALLLIEGMRSGQEAATCSFRPSQSRLPRGGPSAVKASPRSLVPRSRPSGDGGPLRGSPALSGRRAVLSSKPLRGHRTKGYAKKKERGRQERKGRRGLVLWPRGLREMAQEARFRFFGRVVAVAGLDASTAFLRAWRGFHPAASSSGSASITRISPSPSS
jgi:hypothetical protein